MSRSLGVPESGRVAESRRIVETLAAQYIEDVTARCGLRLDAIVSVESVTDVVFRATLDREKVIVKCCLSGTSRVRLISVLSRENQVDAANIVQRVIKPESDGPSSAEVSYRAAADNARGFPIRVPEVIFSRQNIVAVQDLSPATPLAHTRTPPHLGPLWEFLNHIWNYGTTPERHTHAINLAHRHSIESTFERKFNPHYYRDYLDTLHIGERARRSLVALTECVAYHRQRPRARYGLVYGDLKPEHILIGSSETISVIDPAVHRSSAEADVARFLGRYSTIPGLSERHVVSIDHMEDSEGPLAHLDRRLITHLLVMDWLNITTTRSSLGSPTGGVVSDDAKLAEAAHALAAILTKSTANPYEAARRLASICAAT